jgi:hypothetical protein
MVSTDWVKVTANLERTNLRQSPTGEVKVNTEITANQELWNGGSYNRSRMGKVTANL